MKLGFKLMLFGLVAMLALPFIIVKPDGERMLTAQDFLPDSSTFSGAKEALSARFGTLDSRSDSGAAEVVTADSESLRGSGKMYSWRDANGQMHFSENPPEDSSTAAVAALPEDVNLMEAVELPKQPAGAGSGSAQGAGGGFKLAFPSTIPLKDIPKLVDDAKGVQALADKRNAAASEI